MFGHYRDFQVFFFISPIDQLHSNKSVLEVDGLGMDQIQKLNGPFGQSPVAEHGQTHKNVQHRFVGVIDIELPVIVLLSDAVKNLVALVDKFLTPIRFFF
jgi:hypothetical protein